MEPHRAGQKVTSEGGVTVVVVKAATDTVITFDDAAPVLIGKRYRCDACGSEVLVTKAGPQHPSCHDAPMGLAPTKQLPSSD